MIRDAVVCIAAGAGAGAGAGLEPLRSSRRAHRSGPEFADDVGDALRSMTRLLPPALLDAASCSGDAAAAHFRRVRRGPPTVAPDEMEDVDEHDEEEHDDVTSSPPSTVDADGSPRRRPCGCRR